jgi:hypothetical protein
VVLLGVEEEEVEEEEVVEPAPLLALLLPLFPCC